MSAVELCRIMLLLVILVATGQLLVNATNPSNHKQTHQVDIKQQVDSLAVIINNIQQDSESQIQVIKAEFKVETAALEEDCKHQIEGITYEHHDQIILINHQIDTFRVEHSALKVEFKNQIQAIKDEHHVHIDELNHQIEVLRYEHHVHIDELNHQIEILREDQLINNQRQERTISKLTDQTETHPAINNILNSTSLSTNMVYFHVQIAGFEGSPSEHTLIPFDVILLNQGDSYNPASGVFTAPVSGFYHISYEATADSSCGTDNIGVLLFVNTEIMSSSCSEVWSSGGSGITLQLAAEDTIVVKVDQGGGCQTLYSGSSYNNFSGFLIYQII